MSVSTSTLLCSRHSSPSRPSVLGRTILVGQRKTHVAVAAKVLQQLDLTQSTLGKNLLAKDIGDLLDGDTLIALVVDGSAMKQVVVSKLAGSPIKKHVKCSSSYSPHNTVGALTKLLGHGISLIDNKILIEDLEDLASREVRHDGVELG